MTDWEEPQSGLLRQIEHWRRALERLEQFDEIAAPAAWASLAPAVGEALRRVFSDAITDAMAELNALRRQVLRRPPADVSSIHKRLSRFRRRYSQLETTIDFYGDAINSRTNAAMQATMAGLDHLAGWTMSRLLEPLGHAVPPMLTYVDRGLGASILKAGLRLWDRHMISPVAAVKIARHNLERPTALVHETGHQVAHITGWTEELADVLFDEVKNESEELGSTWASWSSEIAADTFAFAQTGYAAVVNLHDVLAGDRDYVLRFVPGDPHPVSYLRVLLGTEMCNVAYGSGPWNTVADAWVRRYPLEDAEPAVIAMIRSSIPLLPRIAESCLGAPLRALGGRSLVDWIDPGEVSPGVLRRVQLASGRKLPCVHTPCARAEGLRTLAMLGLQIVSGNARASSARDAQTDWLQQLGGLSAAA